QSNRQTDAHLSKLAGDLNTRFAREMHTASNELDRQVNTLRSALPHAPAPDAGRRYIRLFKQDSIACSTQLVFRSDALLDPSATAPGRSPSYRLISWSDSTGWQRYKWTTWRSVTPFIDVSALPYVEDAKRARRLYYDPTIPQSGVSVTRSANTAEPLTVIWR